MSSGVCYSRFDLIVEGEEKGNMSSSAGVGFMTVFAISGSVVLVAMQVHKRLLSDFMKKVESELAGTEKYRCKKKVRFNEDVLEPSSNNKEYRLRKIRMARSMGNTLGVTEDVNYEAHGEELGRTMPPNRRALYKGIIEYKLFKGYTVLNPSYVLHNRIQL